MILEKYNILVDTIKQTDLSKYENLYNLLQVCLNIYSEREDSLEYCLKISKFVKEYAQQLVFEKNDVQFEELYWQALLFEAPHLFDSYLLYLEKKREQKAKFYAPKRKHLNKHGLIQALQDLEDDKLDILSISMPPGTQKTTLEKFFASWIIGKHPDDFSLFFSHSGDITRMYYDGVLDITTNSDEYTWNEIFPRVLLESTNAKRETINFNKYKPFANLQCTSVGSKNAGKVRANRYLYCDDLIGGIEEALNKNLLDKLWRIYGTDAKQRKMDGCKEIHIATRWSVHDVIGRLINIYESNERARFIAVPDIDSETGESNFDYEYNGFTVEFFHDQELTMDEISYKCLYKNEPIEREGLLYTNEELRRFITLPAREPDAILGICDTKNTGTDFMFLPCMLKFGDDYYCTACICDDNSDYGVQYERTSTLIVESGMQQCEFESNNGGDRVALEVSKKVEEKGGICNITSRYTESNKETKIIVNADWVKKHVLFKDKELYKSREDYGKMMGFLLSYSVRGKNPHDDIPDGLANFALFVQNLLGVKIQIYSRSELGI